MTEWDLKIYAESFGANQIDNAANSLIEINEQIKKVPKGNENCFFHVLFMIYVLLSFPFRDIYPFDEKNINP